MSSSKLRVLFAIPSLDRDGPDRVMFELLSGLDRSRFAPSLMVSEPKGHYLSRLPQDVAVEVLGPQESLADRYPVLRALRVVRRQHPDVVLATLRMNFTLGVASPAFRRGTGLILRQANDFSADFKMLVRSSPVQQRVARAVSLSGLRRADAVICQSEAMRTDLRRYLGADAPLHAIGNPVDIQAVTHATEARTVSLRGSPSLVSVGRLMPQKGFDLLLPAIAALRSRHPGLHLTILGDGPARQSLEAQSRTLGLEDTVTFAGFSSQVLPTVKAASLFVLASRYEGFPNAALEALACGTPVVLTDCPGANSEIVLPGINGRLASAADTGALVQALDTALGELTRYDRSRIVADCEARYSAKRIIAAYEEVITSVARATRSS
jgi:glycosyltransferase involved in cell wall biosynthesis